MKAKCETHGIVKFRLNKKHYFCSKCWGRMGILFGKTLELITKENKLYRYWFIGNK